MKREDLLANYLDTQSAEERRAIEAEHPELVFEFRALAVVAGRVKASALEREDVLVTATRWQTPPAPQIGPARAALVALSVVAASWMVSGNTIFSSQLGQLVQLVAMGGWLSLWWLRLSPGRSLRAVGLGGGGPQAARA